MELLREGCGILAKLQELFYTLSNDGEICAGLTKARRMQLTRTGRARSDSVVNSKRGRRLNRIRT